MILDGMIETKQHLAKVRVPIPLNKFQRGDILGFDQGDNGRTSNVNTWSICRSEVEAIWMNKEDFADLWHLQNKHPKKLLCDIIRMQACFQTCTEVTLHLLAFELLQTKSFKPGQIICKQNKRSIVNEFHGPYMVNQTNAIMKTALAERVDIDKFGYDARVSNFQLLLKEIARNAKTSLELMRKNQSMIIKDNTVQSMLLS